MAASQSVSLRVPQRLLEHLDAIAIERFPTRKNGEPNRSRMILDFIEKGLDTVSDNIAPQRQTAHDNIEELIRQQVQLQLQIQQVVRQQLELYSPAFPAITELQQEVAEIKRILKSLVTVDNPNTVSDNSSTTSGDRDRQSQPMTASSQPQSATRRQSERSRLEQSQPATASMQPEFVIQQQPEPLIDERSQLSDNRYAISDSCDRPSQSKPAAASTQVQPQSTSKQLPDRDRTKLSDSPLDIALQQSDSPSRDRHLTTTENDRSLPEPATELSSKQPDVTLQSSDSSQPYSTTAVSRVDSHEKGAVSRQQESQPQSTAPQQSERSRLSPTSESDRTPPEQPHSTTAETHAQQKLQPQSTAPQQSDYDCTELSDSPPDIALQQSDSPSRDRHLTATEDRSDRPEPATELSSEQPDVTLQSSDSNQPYSATAISRVDSNEKGAVSRQQESQPQSTAPQQSERSRLSPTTESDRPEQSHSATAETQPPQQESQPQSQQFDRERADTDTVLQQSDKPAKEKPRREWEWPGSVIPKDFVEPGQEPQLSYGNRIVEIETADQLLAEIRWCLDNGGDFVFLYEPAHGHLPPRRAYYLRHSEWYWQGMRPVKTALVKELIDRRAIWTNEPAKGPGSGCRRFYPTAPEATQQSAIASPEPDTTLHSATASTPAQQESQPQSVIPASNRDRPEQSQTGTAYAPAQQEPQLQSTVPTSEQLPERDRPEQSHSATASTPVQQESQPQSAASRSPEPSPEFPEWMTAKQAFQALGGDPGDRDSFVSSANGLKQIKFSAFKSKTSSELKSFGLELSQDRKRRRQPCYRLLKKL